MTRGITTTQDLQDRCWVDEDTGCWHWRGGLSVGKPSMWFAPFGSRCTLSQVIGYLKTGAKLKKGLLCYVTCTTPNCANPEHRKVGTRQGQASVLVAQGRLSKPPLVRAAMSRGRATLLTDAQVMAIRSAQGTCTEIADEFGCSVSHVSLIRRGKTRPLAVAGSSVFSLGATGVLTT